MNDVMGLDTALTRHSIERELDLVAGAIQMVAGGGAPAITLVGLSFGPEVLAGSARAATAARVVLEPLYHSDESGCDIRVHRNEPRPDHA
jgi:hypothetical protein